MAYLKKEKLLYIFKTKDIIYRICKDSQIATTRQIIFNTLSKWNYKINIRVIKAPFYHLFMRKIRYLCENFTEHNFEPCN